ncbi:unnamed protein product (macronuclear) [Paramecium tetraurelia]|uniref:Uncharacterized protein n=1 Tax=Paramecium tetraurelia TaxID=5888 RepID=A0EAD2_PARTE|nr:uncharacterized protein GSPATT00024981001 [Paramecium tetraurelia]CAK92249.1 unnamed protein product [Paramecium tetraurelia]|eukprot:XP_001459646.1 hypothetical protein (macronuclear) [Paramecium tetraurelia strain d4-2]
MFVLQQRVLEKCIIDITKKAFGEQIEIENRGAFLNRIKEITLEAFQLNYGEEIFLLQQELRQSQEAIEKAKLDYLDREQQLIMSLEQKLQEQQILQLKELNGLQEMHDEQIQLNKKLLINLERVNRQNSELSQQNNQLNKEISNLKETYSQFESQQKLKNQEIFEFRQKFEQQWSANQVLEQQYKTMKQEMEKVIKEMHRKNQLQIDENVIAENEVQRLKWEYEQLKSKKHQESQKYKEALEQLKLKSSNKIRDYKQKLKEVQNKDAFIVELQDQIKELQEHIEFQQGQHKSTIKQFENLEQNMEQEKSLIQQHLTKSLETTLNDKDREVLSLFSLTQQLKQSLQNEQDNKQRSIIKLEDQIKQINQQRDELSEEIQDQQLKIEHLEQELIKKDQNIKLLLNDIDELRQFSEQTLNTLRENQDYLSELEREKQQQHEIIENIQNQLEIEIKELEQRCKLFKQEHCLMLEEQLKRQASCEQEIDKLSNENQQNILNFENQQKKLKLEFKLQSEEQMRQYNQLEKESQQMNEQIESLEKQHQELIQDLEQYIAQYTNALSQIEELKSKEKDLIQIQSKNQKTWDIEKQLLSSQLEDQKVQFNKIKQKVIRSVCKQKEQLKQQLNETKQFIQNRFKSYDIDIREFLSSQIKKILQLSNQELFLEKRNHEVILKEFEIEFDRKVDQVKREYKLIQEESDIAIKQKIQQIYQYDQSINDLKKQLSLKLQENDNLQSQFQISNELCKELQKKAEIEQIHSQKLISQLQEELIQIQQTVDFTQKERQYFEQRYNDFKVMSERKLDQVSREYQQQIQQLEVLVQKNEKVDQSHVFLKHSLSSSQGFNRSPNMIKQQCRYSVIYLDTYQKPPNYGSPTLRTPNKSPINERADKTIEELRVEIHQQKEKLSRMKLNFTESQKKSKIASQY